MTRYLFLDIDGVLNSETERLDNGSRGFDPSCVARLNEIIQATDPMIVISSSWRKHIFRGHMTLCGFEIMLASHGIDCRGRIVGLTEPDHDAVSRGILIKLWLEANARPGDRYVILDDGAYWLPGNEDHDIRRAGHGHAFVQTNYLTGLTDEDVLIAILILTKGLGHEHELTRRISG